MKNPGVSFWNYSTTQHFSNVVVRRSNSRRAKYEPPRLEKEWRSCRARSSKNRKSSAAKNRDCICPLGPDWQRVNAPHDAEVFRQAIRALRNEFAFKRGLVLRLLPVVFENQISGCAELFSEEGFASSAQEMRSRTILMDLSPTLAKMHEGMKPHWKRELKVAQKQNLEILEGANDGCSDPSSKFTKKWCRANNSRNPTT